jgi:hypothetical protein
VPGGDQNIALAMLAKETGTADLDSAILCTVYAVDLPFLYWIITGSDGSLLDARSALTIKAAVEMLNIAIMVSLDYSWV